jgi:hypothetical protein
MDLSFLYDVEVEIPKFQILAPPLEEDMESATRPY